jgi:hypothetical protein
MISYERYINQIHEIINVYNININMHDDISYYYKYTDITVLYKSFIKLLMQIIIILINDIFYFDRSEAFSGWS